ncbi:hypothetical protein L226DRAFT_558801 [Lentinus tigrinus ALCF2SS1-7]|uniref:RING-type domain-containing protein n=1 Tax=Lentinus tigrinus ALCF2SS1-6 TaxID=1328759 RepID=A0A5C2SH61_9APHY|nr:hypothetical protein L227DRAFT_599431 [Lentinus tigrinus ALCF2SS1-6]RPD77677.1 hypothetical protein L226DRAFT_558801 [Lentinus tigrinus ALCF2SS1-7]
MDRTPDMLAAYALLADLRRAEGSARNRNNTEPNSLLEMLLNPEFIPPNMRNSDEVRRDDPSLYDDLPPLEDDAGAGPSRAAANRPPSDDGMPALEDEGDDDDGPPPLEPADHSRSGTPSFATAASLPENLGGVLEIVSHVPNPASLRIISDPVPEAPRRHRSVAPVVEPEDGAGNESDGSLPSLQSVSDSSDEEDVFMDDSDSDWDDEESLDYSDDETNLVAQMIENAERNQARTGTARFNMSESINIEPEADFDPMQFTNSAQMYRELLERASTVIPDVASRFHPPPPWVTDLTRLAGVDNDPKRAEILLTAMEVVQDDLVRRYERLRTGDGEDVDGCAICRDDLLDKSPDFGEVQHVVDIFAALPFHPDQDCIVAFPCAGKHLFHRDCLSPWLARKTTCPSCRFDIDPLSLTLQISRGPHDATAHESLPEEEHPSRVWQHPQAESMSDWLSAEEQAQVAGIPRQRPAVRMPEYPPLTPRTATDTAPGAAPRRPVRPPGNSFLAELLRFEGAAFDGVWNFDSEADLLQMRQVHGDAGAPLQNSGLFQRRTAAAVPPRSPSAPPVPPSGASPSMTPSNPPSPLPHPVLGQPSGDFLFEPLRPDNQWDPAPAITSLRRNMLSMLRRQAPPTRPRAPDVPWRPTPSEPSRDAPPHPADLTELHHSPLVLSPPPSGFDFDVPLIPEGASEATPVATPAYFRMASSATTTSSSETRTTGEDGRIRIARTNNVATTYLELVQNHAELLLGSENGPGAFSSVLARNAALANPSQDNHSPATSPPPAAGASLSGPSTGTDDVSSMAGYNPADDLD